MTEDRENYFVLLEISFDENDENKIKKAIEEKQSNWIFTNERVNLGMLDDIRRVMLDPALRKKEAAGAWQKKKEKEKDLWENLRVLYTKNISDKKQLEKQINKTWNKLELRKYGYSKEDCRRIYEKICNKRKDKEESKAVSFITKEDAASIETNLRNLQLAGKSLYDFLGLRASAKIEEINKVASDKQQRNAAKGKKESTDQEENALCEIIHRIFKDNDGKQKYDNYLQIMRFPKFNEQIDLGVEENILSSAVLNELKVSGIEKGIEPRQIDGYIEWYCTFKGYTIKESGVVCELCGTENAAGAATCSNCKKPLFIICPSCGMKNGNAAQKCIQCGFDFSMTEELERKVRQAKEALLAKDISKAEEYIKTVKTYWDSRQDVQEIEKQIADCKKQFGILLRQLDEDIKSRRYYTARRKINEARVNGFSVSTDIVEKVSAKIRDVEKRLEASRSYGKEEAFRVLSALVDEITDSDDVRRRIQNYPPEAVSGVTGERQGSAALVRWNKSLSEGKLEYVLIRKIGAYANHIKDGQEIYRGTALSYADSDVPEEKEVYYSVFVVREDVVSTPCHIAAPVVIVDPLTGVKAVSGDSLLNLSWKRNNSVRQVEMMICQSQERPKGVSQFRNLQNARLDNACINGLENDLSYWVMITACYEINGRIYRSSGVMVQGIPKKPAKPLENFHVRMENQKWIATWDHSQWDVVLCKSEKKPDIFVGRVYDYEELKQTYQKIDMILHSDTEAEFRLDAAGIYYIMPGVMNGNSVIFNNAVLLSNIPPAEALSLSKEHNQLYVEFTWPKRMLRCVLRYRHDRYPEGPEDPCAKSISYTRAQYENDGGIIIQKPEEETYYAAVYICCETEEGWIYSEGARAKFNNPVQKNAYYTIAYKKTFRKGRMLSVTVRLEDGFAQFPGFAVIGKKNGTPINRMDGEVLCTSTQEQTIEGNYTYEFQVRELQKGTRLKLFFINDADYALFRIQNEGSNAI